MSDYRSRVLSGIMVKPDLELTEVEGPLGELLKAADINYLERVHGAHSRPNNFVMLVDEDGRDRGLAYNPMAHYLSGYPIHAPIVGTCLFFSEGWSDDAMGVDLKNLSDLGRDFLKHPRQGGIELKFREWMTINGNHTTEYSIQYRG